MSLFVDTGTTTTLSTTLAETLTSIDTTITLTDASDFPSKGSVTINDETILYTGKSSNDLTGCVRGYDSTNNTAHSNGDTVTTVARVTQAGVSDAQKAGWYIDRLTNDKTLRVNDSDVMLDGIVRFNRNNSIFQGFNGTSWVDFNATTGATGAAGSDGIASFDVANLPSDETVNGEVYSGKVNNELQFRALTSSTFDINATLTSLNSVGIAKSDDYLTLTATSRPYQWDFSTNNTISYLKSSTSDSTFKAFGKISTWKVKSGVTITAGTVVRIALSTTSSGYSDSTTEIVIEPYTYTVLQQEINQGSAPLGIALQTKTNGQSCQICTEGITSVIMGNGDGAGNQTSNTLDGPGAYGFVGYDGKVYNESLSTGISTNTPNIGYWLERGTFTLGTTVLFNVKSSFSFT